MRGENEIREGNEMRGGNEIREGNEIRGENEIREGNEMRSEGRMCNTFSQPNRERKQQKQRKEDDNKMVFTSPFPDIEIPVVPITDYLFELSGRFNPNKAAFMDSETGISLTIGVVFPLHPPPPLRRHEGTRQTR